ncbi:helix-turn-helix domain-containing protein [Escherichia coli]|uniref:helix-turn-helix domain-containing protein n=1 Tax=Escherichia coli TaxID=562 RepID=UPI001923196F
MTVVLKSLSEELTTREAVARFNISNESVVRHWVRFYKGTGEEGLLNIKPGRSKDMTKSQKTPPLTDAELEKWLFRNLGGDSHASGIITLCLSSSNPAQPYIWRFNIFRRFT